MFVPSWLITILAWAPAAEKLAKKTEVPVFFKLFLPVALVAFLLIMAAIVFVGVAEIFKKRVPLEETEGSNIPPLGSGEMTQFESTSRNAPSFGKVAAVIFICGLLLFMGGGMYSMGRGSNTTEQLKKEGAAKKAAERQKKLAAAESSGGGAIVGDDAPSRPRGADFGSGLDGMDAMKE